MTLLLQLAGVFLAVAGAFLAGRHSRKTWPVADVVWCPRCHEPISAVCVDHRRERQAARAAER